MVQEVRQELEGGVLTLVLDRTAKKNALAKRHYDILALALEHGEADAAVKAIVLRSEGDVFCAGNDMGDFAAMGSGEGDFAPVKRFLAALAGLRKPLIAAVQGPAVGIGTTMLLHCDHVLVAPQASLSAPFTRLALVPEAGSSLLLPAAIGHVRAFSTFVLGEAIAAQDAVQWGLANALVDREGLAEAAAEVARRIAALPSGAIAKTKALMRPAEVLSKVIAAEMEQFLAALVSAEAQEAVNAFIARRPAV